MTNRRGFICKRYYVNLFLWGLSATEYHTFSLNFAKIKLIPSLLATSILESVINVSDLSSMEPVVHGTQR